MVVACHRAASFVDSIFEEVDSELVAPKGAAAALSVVASGNVAYGRSHSQAVAGDRGHAGGR